MIDLAQERLQALLGNLTEFAATPDVIYVNMLGRMQLLESRVAASHRRLVDLCTSHGTRYETDWSQGATSPRITVAGPKELESAARVYQSALHSRERGRDHLETAKAYLCDAEFHGRSDCDVSKELLREACEHLEALEEKFFIETE